MTDVTHLEDESCTSSMEVSYMQLEASWLIKQEVPIVCKRVKRMLMRCVDLLKPDRDKPEGGDISNIYFNVKNEQQDELSESQADRRGSVDMTKDDKFVVNIEDLDDIFQDKTIENKPIHFDTPEGSRGTLIFNGWLVESPEILIKFSKPLKQNYSAPIYKTLINKSHPWRIQQIQNSYNYLHLILTELDNLIVFSESYVPLDDHHINNLHFQFNAAANPLSASGHLNAPSTSTSAPTSSSVNVLGQSSSWIPSLNNSHRQSQRYVSSPALGGNTFPELNSLVESFTRISEWLSQARDELLLPSRNVFPATMYQSTVLQPPLPFEINVNVTVANCELVFSVYELHIASKSGGSAAAGAQGGQSHDNSPSKHLLRRSKAQNITSTGSSSSNLSTSTGPILRSSSPGIEPVGTTSSLSDSITKQQESSEHTNTHGIPPFQTTKGGSLQLVTVIDHTEFRHPIPTLVNTFTLLTNAYDRLADLGEKLLVLSNN